MKLNSIAIAGALVLGIASILSAFAPASSDVRLLGVDEARATLGAEDDDTTDPPAEKRICAPRFLQNACNDVNNETNCSGEGSGCTSCIVENDPTRKASYCVPTLENYICTPLGKGKNEEKCGIKKTGTCKLQTPNTTKWYCDAHSATGDPCDTNTVLICDN